MKNVNFKEFAEFALDRKEKIQVKGGDKRKDKIVIDEHGNPVINQNNGDGLGGDGMAVSKDPIETAGS